MPKRFENARIALLNCPLEVEKPEFDAKLNINNPSQMQRFLDEENNMLKSRHNKDFRLRLHQLLHEIVWAKFEISLIEVFRNSSAQRVVTDDFNKVWGWTRMLAGTLDESAGDTKLPHRTIEIGTDHLREDWDNPIRPW